MSMTPAERRRDRQRIGGTIGALRLHATGKTNTLPAREAQKAALVRAVDPDGKLDPTERDRRVAMLRRARMLELSLKSAEARRARMAADA